MFREMAAEPLRRSPDLVPKTDGSGSEKEIKIRVILGVGAAFSRAPDWKPEVLDITA